MFPEGLSPLSSLQRMASPIYGAASWVFDQAQELATEFAVSDGSVSMLGMTFAEECTFMETDVPSSPIPAADALAPFERGVALTPIPQEERPPAFEWPAQPLPTAANNKVRKATNKASKKATGVKKTQATKKASSKPKTVTFTGVPALTPVKRGGCGGTNAALNGTEQPPTPVSAGAARARTQSAFRCRSPTPNAPDALEPISLDQAFVEAAILDAELNAELAVAAQVKAKSYTAAVRAEIIEREVKPLAARMAATRKLRMEVHQQRTNFAAECLDGGAEVLAVAAAATAAPPSPDAESMMEEATRRVLGQFGQQEKRFTASLNQPLRRRAAAAASACVSGRVAPGAKRSKRTRTPTAVRILRRLMAVELKAQAHAVAAAAAPAPAPAQPSTTAQLFEELLQQGFSCGMSAEERARIDELHGGALCCEGFSPAAATGAATAAAAPSFSPFSQAALFPCALVKNLERVRAPKRGRRDEGGLDYLAASAPASKRARAAAAGDEAVLVGLAGLAALASAPVMTADSLSGAVQERAAIGRKRCREEPAAACDVAPAAKRRRVGDAVFTAAPADATVLQPLSGNALKKRDTAAAAAAPTAAVSPAKKGKKKTAAMKKPSAAAAAPSNV